MTLTFIYGRTEGEPEGETAAALDALAPLLKACAALAERVETSVLLGQHFADGVVHVVTPRVATGGFYAIGSGRLFGRGMRRDRRCVSFGTTSLGRGEEK